MTTRIPKLAGIDIILWTRIQYIRNWSTLETATTIVFCKEPNKIP
ncbi:MAG: hypothetical protein ACPKPY_05245 [Nitrososphaeraceae archaeon]